jgi:hypothetical protein
MQGHRRHTSLQAPVLVGVRRLPAHYLHQLDKGIGLKSA